MNCDGMPRRRSNRIAACLLVLGTLVWSRQQISAHADARLIASFGKAAPAGSDGSKAIDTYCSSCHNGAMRSPSTTLLVRFDATASPEMWARAYRQLQADAMPPVGAPRPDRATSDAMLTTIAQALGAETKPAI